MEKTTRQIRHWIIFFMIALVLSGLTAIPLENELTILSRLFSPETPIGAWIDRVYTGIVTMNRQYPFLGYGYDWLAFAHFILAMLFIGPLRDPVKNKWVIEFGMISCLLIVPFAFTAGHWRGIPIAWRLIDCCFGAVGLIPLSICRSKIIELEKITTKITFYEAAY